jgi:hypothetical protein
MNQSPTLPQQKNAKINIMHKTQKNLHKIVKCVGISNNQK